MSRKHYIEIATVLAQHGASETLLFEMAKIFESDNPRFEVSRFLAKVIEVKDKLREIKRVRDFENEIDKNIREKTLPPFKEV